MGSCSVVWGGGEVGSSSVVWDGGEVGSCSVVWGGGEVGSCLILILFRYQSLLWHQNWLPSNTIPTTVSTQHH